MGAIQRFNIKKIIDEFDIRYFVETGTLEGDAVQFVKDLQCENIKEIHSIEILEDLHQNCQSRFEDDENIHIHHGLSVDVLGDIIQEMGDGNILFWLDAHYPGADVGRASYIQKDKDEREVLPMEAEMRIIDNIRGSNHQDVFVCDDLWLYEDGEYGGYGGQLTTLDNHMKIYHNGETKEQMGKPDANFVDELFGDTHDITKSKIDQGYILMFPKRKQTA